MPMIPAKSERPTSGQRVNPSCACSEGRERRGPVQARRDSAASSQGCLVRWSRQRFLLLALLAIAVIALYAPLTGYDFINIDDSEYVIDNEHINHGLSWSSVKWAFTHPVAGNWHPLTMLSHMLDCQVYGLFPGGHHLTNGLFHCANTFLLFWVLLRMTDRTTGPSGNRAAGKSPATTTGPPSNLWPCLLVAALFALHPLHVESVAWISERKDVLSAFFFLLTLWAYSNFATRQSLPSRPSLASRAWYSLSLLFFTLGLMSKSMLVTVPFVLLLLDYWPLDRLSLHCRNLAEAQAPNAPARRTSGFTSPRPSIGSLLLEKLPFLALAALFSVITVLVQKRAGAVVALHNFPLEPRLANAVVSYARYLGKTFWPASLAMPYPHLPWQAWQIQGAAALLVGLSVVAGCAVRRRPYLFVGWFFFVGMLVPVIGVIQVGQQAMADHFTYLPLIGIFVALAWGLADLPVSPARRPLLASGAAVLLAALMAAAWAQIRCWKDSETLFQHALCVMRNNSQAHYLLGALSESQGKTEQALGHLTAAIRDNPGHVKAHCGLAYLLYGQGKFQEAAQEYQAALSFEPDSPKAHFGLAEALRKQGQPDPAIAHYLLSLRSQPDIAEAHYALAGLLSGKQDPAAGITHLREAVRLAPDWTLALNNLAWMLATQPEPKLRNGTEATRLALRAVCLTRRSNPNTLDTLAAAYAETGRFSDAVETAQSAFQKAAAASQTNLSAEIQSRLKLYQSHRPYRE
jgi:protein O-mannosyl-transferase